jgi:hypothetical protein
VKIDQAIKEAKKRSVLRNIRGTDSKSSLLYQYEMAKRNLLENALDKKEFKNLLDSRNVYAEVASRTEMLLNTTDLKSKSFDTGYQHSRKLLRRKFDM